MRDLTMESLVGRPKARPATFDSLMRHRVQNILLVSSMYDSFIFEEEGRLTEQLLSDYVELNLRYAPLFVRVSTASEALDHLRSGASFDLVISMLRVGDMPVAEFGAAVKRLDPHLPVVLLAYDTREITILGDINRLTGIDRVFSWQGDVRLFLAIIKLAEDRLNVERDTRIAGVQVVILIEDSIRFYSSYLPMLYTELVEQTQALMGDSVNRQDRLLRMRARPKILLATTFEEGLELYDHFQEFVAGVITDARFPRGGRIDPEAGIAFARLVKERTPDRPILLQSTEERNRAKAEGIGLIFLNKNSPKLLHELEDFIHQHLGFGDFIFRLPAGDVVGRAADLRTFIETLHTLPAESILYHAGRNDFSLWLMARTEFALARRLRPHRVSDFDDTEALRTFLIDLLAEHRDASRAGVVTEFTKETFEAGQGFVQIGDGQLGGKGRGLAFFYRLLEQYPISDHIPTVEISVPPTAVLATGVFERFMADNALTEQVLGTTHDLKVIQAFLACSLPADVVASLRTFLERVTYPLAVRSSSLLEDASYQPFAGIYRTIMIPNNSGELDERVRQLVTAIKLVYASTYSNGAKVYLETTPNRIEEERMAVIIQQIAGRQHDHYLYPDLAGVVRSYNYYPMGGMDPSDGVASVVLGLGKAVVEGKKSVRFSPASPQRLHQFASAEMTFQNAQGDFEALDLAKAGFDELEWSVRDGNLVTLDLATAEEHGTLGPVGSVYSAENEAVYDGTSRPGVRLVTLAGVLKSELFPLAKTLALIAAVGRAGFSSEVEIEFACTFKDGDRPRHVFSFLQIRPVVVSMAGADLDIYSVAKEDALVITKMALGHGAIEGIQDIVYIPMDRFDRAATVAIANEIGTIMEPLRRANRPVLLVGPGRWGSADRWLGIPVTWQQISGVGCIVETGLLDIQVEPSQGTHFFQNITSFQIGYFTVHREAGDHLDLSWLDSLPASAELTYVRQVTLEEPLRIIVASKSRGGVIMKPGVTIGEDDEPEPIPM